MQTDNQINRRTGTRSDRQTDDKIDRRTETRSDRQTHRQTIRQTDVQAGGQTDTDRLKKDTERPFCSSSLSEKFCCVPKFTSCIQKKKKVPERPYNI